MARHQSDSSQMKEVLQPDNHSAKHPEEKHEREPVSESRASSTPSFAPSSTGAVSRRRTERDEPFQHQREERNSLCLLEELKHLSQCSNKLGPLYFSRTHTVLIDVQHFNTGAGTVPKEGRDTWSSDFVKLPCSHTNVMTVKTGFPKKSTWMQRWDVISRHLGGLARKTKVKVADVEEAIIQYNLKYKGQWTFEALSSFVKVSPKAENDICTLFPKIAELALRLPRYVKKGIPLLRRGCPAKITLSQSQISCLLANAFFCTFPHRNTTHSNAEYHNLPTINFASLFRDWSGRKREKLRAIMHYFKVATDENNNLNGLVTFERRGLSDTDMPNWRCILNEIKIFSKLHTDPLRPFVEVHCKETMPKLHVTSHGVIETEGAGMLQVDFASSWIGGGVLGSGLVQEEILFLINPELIVSRLFTEKLEDSECLIITGSQQFSCYSGFGDSFEWSGPYEDPLERDEWSRRKRQILAIDALNYKHRMEQYNIRKVTRELNKAYCGFKGHGDDEPDIATGKWGCGAFNGDPQLKAVIQLMAAAKAKRGLAFFTFKDEKLRQGLQQIYNLLLTERTTVEKLYTLLEDFFAVQKALDGAHVELFEFMRNTLKSSRSQL